MTPSKFFFVFIALLMFFGAREVAFSAEQKLPPFDESQSAIDALVWSKPKPGYAYLINGGRTLGLRVYQNVDNGVIVKVNFGSYTSYNVPDRLFLQTSRLMADGQVLPAPLCGVYTGLYKYNTLLGVSTIHKFKEISCKPYIEKYRREASRTPPSAENGQSKQIPYHTWVSSPTGDPDFSIYRLLPNEPMPPIDLNRWELVFERKMSEEDKSEWSFFVDKRSIIKYQSESNRNYFTYKVLATGRFRFSDGEASDNYLIKPKEVTLDCARVRDVKNATAFTLPLYPRFCGSGKTSD